MLPVALRALAVGLTRLAVQVSRMQRNLTHWKTSLQTCHKPSNRARMFDPEIWSPE